MKKAARIPECHPDRKHEAHGKCVECYKHWYRRAFKEEKREALRKWRKDNTEKARQQWVRRDHPSSYSRFGLNIHEYRELVKKFNGRCPICFGTKFKKRLAIDHCHKTNKIRGMLCNNCNLGIGYFEDDPQRLRQAAVYIEGLLFQA